MIKEALLLFILTIIFTFLLPIIIAPSKLIYSLSTRELLFANFKDQISELQPLSRLYSQVYIDKKFPQSHNLYNAIRIIDEFKDTLNYGQNSFQMIRPINKNFQEWDALVAKIVYIPCRFLSQSPFYQNAFEIKRRSKDQYCNFFITQQLINSKIGKSTPQNILQLANTSKQQQKSEINPIHQKQFNQQPNQLLIEGDNNEEKQTTPQNFFIEPKIPQNQKEDLTNQTESFNQLKQQDQTIVLDKNFTIQDKLQQVNISQNNINYIQNVQLPQQTLNQIIQNENGQQSNQINSKKQFVEQNFTAENKMIEQTQNKQGQIINDINPQKNQQQQYEEKIQGQKIQINKQNYNQENSDKQSKQQLGQQPQYSPYMKNMTDIQIQQNLENSQNQKVKEQQNFQQQIKNEELVQEGIKPIQKNQEYVKSDQQTQINKQINKNEIGQNQEIFDENL